MRLPVYRQRAGLMIVAKLRFFMRMRPLMISSSVKAARESSNAMHFSPLLFHRLDTCLDLMISAIILHTALIYGQVFALRCEYSATKRCRS